jgi:hypothetical protein
LTGGRKNTIMLDDRTNIRKFSAPINPDRDLIDARRYLSSIAATLSRAAKSDDPREVALAITGAEMD